LEIDPSASELLPGHGIITPPVRIRVNRCREKHLCHDPFPNSPLLRGLLHITSGYGRMCVCRYFFSVVRQMSAYGPDFPGIIRCAAGGDTRKMRAISHSTAVWRVSSYNFFIDARGGNRTRSDIDGVRIYRLLHDLCNTVSVRAFSASCYFVQFPWC
jgi:hypothetical protein